MKNIVLRIALVGALAALPLTASAVMTDAEATAAVQGMLTDGRSSTEIIKSLMEDGRNLEDATVLSVETATGDAKLDLARVGICLAEDVADLFSRLEQSGNLLRIDPSVEPTAYHCAVISRGELDQLRRIDNIVRLGRVERIESDRIVLASGEIPTDPSVLHVDCSAEGIPRLPAKPIFDGDTITLQWVRTCQPTFSAAMIGFVESQDYDEATKNTICSPIEPPTEPRDWLRMMQIELANRATWAENPDVAAWQGRSRLDSFSALIAACLGVDKEGTQHLSRYLANFEPARSKLPQLLAD